MNTSSNGASFGDNTAAPVASQVATIHKTHRFRLLLQREFWEHKGGFLWAPLVAGGISLLLTLMVIVIGVIAMRKAIGSGEIKLDDNITINGLDLGALVSQLKPEDMAQLSDGINLSVMSASIWPFIVLVFVMFFYCLGALFDERKDRSVLFWKSLPVSDTETVLSKVASAVLVAPLLATLASVLTMFCFLVLISVVVLVHGGNPFTLLWANSHPLTLAAQYLMAIPVYALWAMPTVGWLLMCSAWAKSKPFLWAVMIPVFAGIFVAWFQVMGVFDLDTWWFWKNIVLRLLGSVVPITWTDIDHMQQAGLETPGALRDLVHPTNVYRNLTSPDLWIGVAAGAAMIFAAIRLRRWRDEG